MTITFKKITTNIVIFSFFLVSASKADFYVKTDKNISLLSNNDISVVVPKNSNFKLLGELSYSQQNNGSFNVIINWNTLEKNGTQQAITLNSQFIVKELFIKKNSSILVKGNLPLANETSSQQSQAQVSSLNDEKLQSSLDKLANDNYSTNVSGSNNKLPNNAINLNPNNKLNSNIATTTAIDDCPLTYNPEKESIDVYVKDFYYNSKGAKTVLKDCYKQKTVPAKYQECTVLNDYSVKKTYYRRQAIYVDRKTAQEEGQSYAASACMPYHTYDVHFDTIETKCPAYIDYDTKIDKGKYYYVSEDGKIHYLTDCVMDPNHVSKLSIEYGSCQRKDYIKDNYSTYYGRYYYYDHQNTKVQIGDCQDLGSKSQFKHKLHFLKWNNNLEDLINKPYSVAVQKRFITVLGEEILINKEEEDSNKIPHIETWSGKWINHDKERANPGEAYSNKEILTQVTLPQPNGSGVPITFSIKEGDRVNHEVNYREERDTSVSCFQSRCKYKYYTKRPDGTEYLNKQVWK